MKMLRLGCVVLTAIFTVNVQGQAISLNDKPVINEQPLNEQHFNGQVLSESDVVEVALAQQIIDHSGLLSLSQQVKYSAQQFIQGDQTINHAQHFAIAKSLAKRWTEEAWQQRLLQRIEAMPIAQQQAILQQLTQPLIQSAQQKERQAIAIQHSDEYQRYMAKLRQRPPAASRWQLIETLDKNSGFSQMLIKARAAVIKDISRQVKDWQVVSSWQADTQQEVLEFLFYAYRKTPNAELQRIAQSFNQPELSAFYGAVRKEIY